MRRRRTKKKVCSQRKKRVSSSAAETTRSIAHVKRHSFFRPPSVLPVNRSTLAPPTPPADLITGGFSYDNKYSCDVKNAGIVSDGLKLSGAVVQKNGEGDPTGSFKLTYELPQAGPKRPHTPHAHAHRLAPSSSPTRKPCRPPPWNPCFNPTLPFFLQPALQPSVWRLALPPCQPAGAKPSANPRTCDVCAYVRRGTGFPTARTWWWSPRARCPRAKSPLRCPTLAPFQASRRHCPGSPRTCLRPSSPCSCFAVGTSSLSPRMARSASPLRGPATCLHALEATFPLTRRRPCYLLTRLAASTYLTLSVSPSRALQLIASPVYASHARHSAQAGGAHVKRSPLGVTR